LPSIQTFFVNICCAPEVLRDTHFRLDAPGENIREEDKVEWVQQVTRDCKDKVGIVLRICLGLCEGFLGLGDLWVTLDRAWLLIL
jgi:hypothetical protein